MNRTNKAKLNIPICVACVLLCLTMISIHLSSGLYARYTTSASGADGSRVAIMSTGVSGFDVPMFDMSPGETAEIDFFITNAEGGRVCEVTQAYEIKVDNVTDNIPFTWELYSGDEQVAYTGVMQANDATEVDYTLVVTWPESANDADLAFEVDMIRGSIDSAQVD